MILASFLQALFDMNLSQCRIGSTPVDFVTGRQSDCKYDGGTQPSHKTRRPEPRTVSIGLTDTGREVFVRCMKEAAAFEAKMP
ncbi:hypothetical protein [Neisseria iguanae]|uniref:Uncharacterized protein n=1 Tax=Neisseria iguanae TaxID=90242 RepID=A0A2P7TYA6_9NEIS|nr:hypothetical protein [Neisseria iguanae]PSJ79710.1 hypothetical protein C7N83_10605 [Neisseria iguanae]